MAFPSSEAPTRRHIDSALKDLLYEAQGGRCNFCGRKIDKAYFHVNHLTPVSRNGSDRPKNLQLLCGPCNTRKGDQTDGEFRRLYKLTPAREAKGPPTKGIPQQYFEGKSKAIKTQKAKRRRRDFEVWW